MSRVVLTETLQEEYNRLFATCNIETEYVAAVDALIDTLMADRSRYHDVAGRLKMPWFVVAVLHYTHTQQDFSVHLHNGDPLTERTRHWPDGRPAVGEPPFSWEDSAADALCCWHFERWDDWTISGILFLLEGHDSWGYRLNHPQVLSPYLWNYSSHYHQGKYVTDDTWNESAIAQHCGVAVLLRRLAERKLIEFSQGSQPALPPVRFSTTETSPSTIALQRFLNTLPGLFVKVDGLAGPKTSDAFHQFSGRYLLGDPRDNGKG